MVGIHVFGSEANTKYSTLVLGLEHKTSPSQIYKESTRDS